MRRRLGEKRGGERGQKERDGVEELFIFKLLLLNYY